jgi:hypothetical protein
MNQTPPFTVPENIIIGNLDNLFQEVAKAKAVVKDIEDRLNEAKKEYDNYEALLITAIQETGSSKVEFEKGMWAKIDDKYYYNFVKPDKPALFEWLTENSGDDIITVMPQSLGGFIRERIKEEGESEEDTQKRLPEFITNYKKTSLTLSTKAVNQFRKQL